MPSKLQEQNDLLARLLAQMEESQKNEPELWTGKDSGNTSVAEIEAYEGIKDALEEFREDRLEIVNAMEELSQNQSNEIDKLVESLGALNENNTVSIQNEGLDRISEALSELSESRTVVSTVNIGGIQEQIAETNTETPEPELSPLEISFAEMVREMASWGKQEPPEPTVIKIPEPGLTNEIQTITEQEPPEPESKLGGRPTLDADYIGNALEAAFNQSNFSIETTETNTEIPETPENIIAAETKQNNLLETISANVAIIANAYEQARLADEYSDPDIQQAKTDRSSNGMKINDGETYPDSDDNEEGEKEEPSLFDKFSNSKLGTLMQLGNLAKTGGSLGKVGKVAGTLLKHGLKWGRFGPLALAGTAAATSLMFAKESWDQEAEERDNANELAKEQYTQTENENSSYNKMMQSGAGGEKLSQDNIKRMNELKAKGGKITWKDTLFDSSTDYSDYTRHLSEEEKAELKALEEKENRIMETKKAEATAKRSETNITVQAKNSDSATANQAKAAEKPATVITQESTKATQTQDSSVVGEKMIEEQKNSSERIVSQLAAMNQNLSRPAVSRGGSYTLTGD